MNVSKPPFSSNLATNFVCLLQQRQHSITNKLYVLLFTVRGDHLKFEGGKKQQYKVEKDKIWTAQFWVHLDPLKIYCLDKKRVFINK
jgi:hypothetical protein